MVDSPNDPADPNTLTWFYPGQWFGVSEPVPTIQLAWLRRAQQDYEYLWLAAQQGEVINALQMARLITKPVEIQPGQAADPVYALLTGTTSQETWDRAQELLAKTILLRKPGQPVDEARQRALHRNAAMGTAAGATAASGAICQVATRTAPKRAAGASCGHLAAPRSLAGYLQCIRHHPRQERIAVDRSPAAKRLAGAPATAGRAAAANLSRAERKPARAI